MIRIDTWQTALTEAIEAKRAEPYSIVDFNCLLWACFAIEAQTGIDFYKQFAGKFKTPAGAAKTLRQIGQVETCADWLQRCLETEQKHIAFARKGDIVVADIDQAELAEVSDVNLFGAPVGVCYGFNSFFVGFDGLVVVETLELGPSSYGLSC